MPNGIPPPPLRGPPPHAIAWGGITTAPPPAVVPPLLFRWRDKDKGMSNLLSAVPTHQLNSALCKLQKRGLRLHALKLPLKNFFYGSRPRKFQENIPKTRSGC